MVSPNVATPAPAQPGNGRHNNTSDLTADPAKLTQKPEVSQVKIEIICDEIGFNISPMIATLEAALAMREAGNVPGFLYGLRCAGAYWKYITTNAKDLVALQNGEASQ
jgi:hypothetical protein